MRLLVIEDDEGAARVLRRGLTEEGHAVDVASDGATGLEQALAGNHDVLVVDIMLPELSGIELVTEFRAAGRTTPVVLLTGLDSTSDVIRGLDSGADDYLTKPFDFGELLARVRALGRRATGTSSPDEIVLADITMDRVRRTVERAGHALDLTPREFRLLEHLMLRHGQAQARLALIQKVWDMPHDPGTNVVEAHISNLRAKLEAHGGTRVIHTVRGHGYVMRVDGP